MEAPTEIGASIREKGRSGKYWLLLSQSLSLLVDGFNRLDRLGFLIGDLTGRELGFELLDDFGVHLLVDLHLEGEHQADSTVRGCCVAHFFFSSKRVGAEITH